ncbi:hypothetical protein KKF34_15855 [Myxococcota bacterium]|nr:hypothetical protein [Myxococcota bacterium]MBU1381302.1 hypothetical protein [Myxococcota bacterium]MBU1498351.1 hypothetical protein [Myxococcota bacterium]
MKKFLFLLLISTVACSFDSSGPGETGTCRGVAPAADNQVGVCSGAVKICEDGEWVEPDYSLISGWEETEQSCDDLDNDCDGIVDAGECGANSQCQVSETGPVCGCDEGYEDTGSGCTDINECESNPCDVNADCENTEGSFSCTCKTGYSGDGFNCEDVDDCVGNSCHADAECIDGINSYECVCRTGYIGDGFSCAATSCRRIKITYPMASSGNYTINTGISGEIEVYCDMASDNGSGYTMVRIDDASLLSNQDAYHETCAALGMEVIVPRTKAHALAMKAWNGGAPNLVNVFGKYDGAQGLENFEGRCQGQPCNFYLSDTRNSTGTTEPSGNNTTAYSLYLWNTNTAVFGNYDDGNNWVNFPGYVICSTNDNPEPPIRSSCWDYSITNTLWNKGPWGVNGPYKVNVGGAPMDIFCDQLYDGGGWMLVLNYVHSRNTNPALSVLTDRFPMILSDTLGYDESAESDYWGHAGNALLSTLDFNEVRFYGRSSAGANIIHFETADASCLDYFKTGTGSCDPAPNYIAMLGHSGRLPNRSRNGASDQGDFALTEGTFYNENLYNWNIRGNGIRWEADNNDDNDSRDTIHRVWVRRKYTGATCLDILQNHPDAWTGFYVIDPDGPGGKTPFMTYCDMTTRGGGWSLVVVYGKNSTRPTKFTGDYPRPGGSFYTTDYDGINVPFSLFIGPSNNGTFAGFSVDASELYAVSSGEFMAYVGGSTDDYIYGILPSTCNFFDIETVCWDDTHGPFEVYKSDETLVTSDAYACTTAHNSTPYEADTFNEYGLHILDGMNVSTIYHCFSGTNNLTGHQNVGRIFTTFEGTGGFWPNAVHSHWNEAGVLNQLGVLFLR